MINPNMRVSHDLKSHKNSIFNPQTNYEVEKSEHVDMSLSHADDSMDMGNCLLDQSNEVQDFQGSLARSNANPMNPKSLTSDNQYMFLSPKKKKDDSHDGSYKEGMSIKEPSERKFSLNNE